MTNFIATVLSVFCDQVRMKLLRGAITVLYLQHIHLDSTVMYYVVMGFFPTSSFRHI